MLLFDIGANIGRYAIKNYNASTKIICVEASPRTAEKLRKNVECYENIIVENLAVSDSKQDTVSFYESQLDPLSTLDINWLLSDKSRFGNMNHNINMVEIKTISIDSLIQKYGIPDLLKIDVEGAEDRVINSLSMKVPVLCFEWAAEWRHSINACIDKLTSLGFTKFDIQNGDEYSYRPASFNLSGDGVKNFIKDAKDKEDWGMIWSS
jgi:FkbM family methyltransferase